MQERECLAALRGTPSDSVTWFNRNFATGRYN